jgi:putative MFS transporter
MDTKCSPLTISFSQPEQEITKIQEVYEKYGYGLTTFKFLFISACVIMCYGLHLSIFGLLAIPYKESYSLTDLEMKLSSSFIFLGLACGSFLLSFVKQAKYMRKTILVIFSFILTISHLLMGLIFNPIVFIILRFVVGACIGIILPGSYTLLTEHLPLKNRSFVLSIVWSTYTVARVFLLVTMLIFMPNLESDQIQIVTLLNLIIPFLTCLVCLFLVKDSPRNLILINRTDEAYHILEGMLGRHLTDNEKKNIHDDVYLGINHELKGSVFDMFSSKLLRSTISIITIWCIHGFVFYGTFLTSGMTIKDLGLKKDQSNYDTIIGHFLIAGTLTPPVFLIGAMTEMKFFGRKRTYFLTYFVGAIGVLLAILIPSQFSWIYGLGTSFMGAGNNLGGSYASEIYPTKVRESAISFLYFTSRLFTALSQIVYLWIYNDFGMDAPYYMSVGMLCVLLIAIVLLPYETHSKHLDVDYSKEEENKHYQPIQNNVTDTPAKDID